MKPGDLVVVGSGLAELIEQVEHDPLWRVSGWHVLPVRSGTGDGYGLTTFRPDHLGWRLAPLDWTSCTDGRLEERWTYNARRDSWRREIRRIMQDGAQ
jgi:hypothetical protein